MTAKKKKAPAAPTVTVRCENPGTRALKHPEGTLGQRVVFKDGVATVPQDVGQAMAAFFTPVTVVEATDE